MDRTDLLKKLGSVIGSVLNRPGLTLREDMTALDVDGWDSMTNALIIMEIDDQIGVAVSADEMIEMKNIGSLLDVLAARSK